MEKVILLILGIFSIIYGILIRQGGSGTWFWIVWEVIGAFLLLWSFLIQKGFFITHKRTNNLLHVFISVTLAALILFCSMITGEFHSKGEEKLDYVIVLGAQGYNEPFSEAEGMHGYLVENGIDSFRAVQISKKQGLVIWEYLTYK